MGSREAMSPKEIYIFDAGPLIHLSELSLDKLIKGFCPAYTSEIVASEVDKHVLSNQSNLIKDKLSVIELASCLVTVKLLTIAKLFALDYGEVTALAIAIDLKANNHSCIFVSDDSAARLAADNLAIKSVGTIGIIIKAVTNGLIQPIEALDTLYSIPERTSLHIKKEFLSTIISKLKIDWQL